jgi:hypothetical protein
MKCPHCAVAFHDHAKTHPIVGDADGGWMLWWVVCPTCHRAVIGLLHGKAKYERPHGSYKQNFVGLQSEGNGSLHIVRPKASMRPICPKEVPRPIAEDYSEACLVLPDSPKASAALSRVSNIFCERRRR